MKRSSHPPPKVETHPPSVRSRHSHTHPNWRATNPPSTFPRGHLSYYRTIKPPTSCIAFRARVDYEGEEGERAVLGTAGEEAVYLWDLDEVGRVEVIRIKEEDRCPIQVSFNTDVG